MGKNKKDVKVDLKLLKQLVGELESVITNADALLSEKSEDNLHDYVVEMSKASGVAAGIVEEATLLVSDIRQAIRYNSSPIAKDDALSSILGVLKGGTGNSGLPGSN